MTPDQVTDIATRDTNRLVGNWAKVLALKSPFIDVLPGGTLSNVSDAVRVPVQERAVVAASLAKPVFTLDSHMCGDNGSQDRTGSTEYSIAPGTMRGRGPRICVKAMRTAFKDSYINATQAMEKAILQIKNADIRSTLHMRSGVKFVCNSGYTFDNLITGDSQLIDQQFLQVLPDSPLPWKTLRRLGSFLKEDMLSDPFESETGTMFKLIGSDECIERIRNDLDVKTDLLALTMGKYQIGEQSINSYAFQGPYRNFAFGVDQQPLRATGFDANGDLVLVEPEIATTVTNGVAARRNPTWVSAPYEIAFLLCRDTFKLLVPESYAGEGTFKFNPQLVAGELEWAYFRDNCENLFGDYGQHIYQISRAFQPTRPHAVMPILYKRCQFDTGFSACTSSVSGL